MSHEQPNDHLAPMDRLQDWYVNTVWGKRSSDDDSLFEVMSLQLFQAGLNWRMVLSKRDGFRSAFANWSIKTAIGEQHAVSVEDFEEWRAMLKEPALYRAWKEKWDKEHPTE